jgi:uncharacterized protein (DUF433 family)
MRIRLDIANLPAKAFVHRSFEMAIALDQHIESTPTIRGGRPRISGTRISVDDIVIMYVHLAQCVEEIVAKYELTPAAVHAALVYYYDHKSEIDQTISDDDAVREAFIKDNPSKLQEKLKAIARG